MIGNKIELEIFDFVLKSLNLLELYKQKNSKIEWRKLKEFLVLESSKINEGESDCDKIEVPGFCLMGTIKEFTRKAKEAKNQWLG